MYNFFFMWMLFQIDQQYLHPVDLRACCFAYSNQPFSTKLKQRIPFLVTETFSVDLPEPKECCLEMAPSFIVPLKMRNSPECYECYMSCAVTGKPTPHITWYRNNISLNTNTNYYITNTCGVCSMKILKVSSKDSGDYTVVAENPLGRAECSARLAVKGKST